jgi:copper chaperone CopZ
MKTTIYCPDIECDSCVNVIGRVLGRQKGVASFKVKQDRIDIEHDADVKPHALTAAIKEKGYRASLEPFVRTTLRDRAKEFVKNKEKYAIEWRMLRYITASFFILIALEAVLVYVLSRAQPNFLATHGWWLFYLTVSVVALGGALWHFKAYRGTVTCMVGMMIGMTIGMQTGMMLGAIFGATNGFFIGAMTGMLVAAVVGTIAGNCCGIMGVMEGLMAAIMGGTMGAMISFMMFTDHLLWFMPVYMLLNLVILAGFSLMLFEEVVEGKDVVRKPLGFGAFLGWTGLALAGLTALMLLAPASVFLR